jgi:hypothetical protein
MGFVAEIRLFDAKSVTSACNHTSVRLPAFLEMRFTELRQTVNCTSTSTRQAAGFATWLLREIWQRRVPRSTFWSSPVDLS